MFNRFWIIVVVVFVTSLLLFTIDNNMVHFTFDLFNGAVHLELSK